MQKLKFPMEYLRVTQRYGIKDDGTPDTSSYSHAGTYALDFGGKDTGSDKLYAPCDLIVKRRRQKANGELYLESTLPVEFADGTSDYVHLLFLHDSAFNVVEGQVITQGQYFYDEGGMGSGKAHAFGTHVHIEGGKGKWKSTTQAKNSCGVYASENQFPLHKLFILGDDVQILDGGGYDWKRVSDLTAKPQDDGFVYGVDISHNRSKDIMKKISANGKAKFVIYRSAVGSSSPDKYLQQFISDTDKNMKVGFFPANYFGSVQDAIEEADYTINTIENLGFTPKKLSLPVFCDWEGFSYDYQAGLGNIVTPDLLRKMTEAFCERIKQRGYKTGVYLNKNYWDNWYGQAFFDSHPDYYIWYARPGLDKPDRDCYLWQYACNEGTEYGVNEPLDKNILFGEYISNSKIIWDITDKYLEITGKNCEYFSATDVNTAQGYLPKDAVYEVKKISTEMIGGFMWAEIKMTDGSEAFVVILEDRCALIDKPNLYEEQIKVLKENNEKLAVVIEDCHVVISDKNKEIEKLSKDISSLSAANGALEAELNKQAKLYSDLLAEYKSLTKELDELAVENNYLKEKVSAYEEKISSANKELTGLAKLVNRVSSWLKGV